MKCHQCGFENIDSSVHCLNCGARLDGNINCPKCGKTISPDFDRCPHCKCKIPHRPKEEPVVEATKKEHVSSIFNKIFLIVIIVLLAISMGTVWSEYVTFFKDGLIVNGNASYFLFKSWGDMTNELLGLTDTFQRSAVYFEYISQFLIVLLNMTVTYCFGIFGIVLSSLSLKKKGLKECKTYKFLAIVFASNLLAAALLLSFHGNGAYGNSQIPASLISYFSGTASTILVMSIFSIVIRHEPGKKSLTFEKIVFAINFYISAMMMAVLSTNLLYNKDYGYSFRNGSLFLSVLSDASVLRSSNEGMALLLSSTSSLIITLVEIISLSVLIIFFSQGFYSEKERSMKFKIPCYSFSFISFVLSSIQFVISIVTAVFAQKVYGGTFIIGELPWINFILGILLFGASFASLTITRAYRRYMRISAQTTKK